MLAACAAITTIASVHASANEAVLRRRHPDWFARYRVGSDEFWLPTDSVDLLESIREAVDARSRDGDPVLFVPLLVTLYPLWSRRVPIYDMFCVHAATPGAEDAMIDSLERENVRVAVVWNVALDGLEERRFSRTHPQVWRYPRERVRAVPPYKATRGLPLLRETLTATEDEHTPISRSRPRSSQCRGERRDHVSSGAVSSSTPRHNRNIDVDNPSAMRIIGRNPLHFLSSVIGLPCTFQADDQACRANCRVIR